MDNTTRRLRSQLVPFTRGKAPTAVRYPAALRQAVVRVARQRQAHGDGVRRIAREVGVAPRTLELWLRRRGAPRLRAVEIAPGAATAVAAPEPRPVLITPHGFRIEGLELGALTTLLRALA